MSTATLPVIDDAQLEDLFDLDVRIELDEASASTEFTSWITCSSCYVTWCCAA